MITEITKAQLLVWRLGILMNENRATPQQITMAKRNSCEIAANIARDARQMLGGMGITGRIQHHAPHDEPGERDHLRRNTRCSFADYRNGCDRAQRVQQNLTIQYHYSTSTIS